MPWAGKLTNSRELPLFWGRRAVGSRPRRWRIWGLVEAISWFRQRAFAMSSLTCEANVTIDQGLSQGFPELALFSFIYLFIFTFYVTILPICVCREEQRAAFRPATQRDGNVLMRVRFRANLQQAEASEAGNWTQGVWMVAEARPGRRTHRT